MLLNLLKLYSQKQRVLFAFLSQSISICGLYISIDRSRYRDIEIYLYISLYLLYIFLELVCDIIKKC